MKRSVSLIALLGLMTFLPVSAHADSATPTPHPSNSVNNSVRSLARQAARSALNVALSQARNGRDLAFADAGATLMQSLQAAGKDRVAKQSAHLVYKMAATGIITAYKQAVVLATQNFKAALAAIK